MTVATPFGHGFTAYPDLGAALDAVGETCATFYGLLVELDRRDRAAGFKVAVLDVEFLEAHSDRTAEEVADFLGTLAHISIGGTEHGGVHLFILKLDSWAMTDDGRLRHVGFSVPAFSDADEPGDPILATEPVA